MHAVDFPARQRHPRDRYVIDCGRAQIQILARSLATVLRVDGEIDGCNAERVVAEVRRFARLRLPLVLDLSHLDFLGTEGFQLILAVNHELHEARLYCSVVSGAALRPLLRIVRDHGLPLVESVPEALQLFDDALGARRRQQPDLGRVQARL